MKKRKVRRFQEGDLVSPGFASDEERKRAMRGAIMETGAYADADNYGRNENRAGRMSTLDPSDIEDAIRGRQMTGTLGNVEYPNRLREAAQAAGTAGEDTGVGMLSGVTRPATTPATTKPKPPVVTKEQMQKAGYDNLRDYLNAQQGLRRRGTPAKTEEVSYQYDSKKFMLQNRREALAEEAREARISPSIMKADRFGMEPDAYILKRKLKEAGYKKGGKVSSASKRADGIATKGKTRGRII